MSLYYATLHMADGSTKVADIDEPTDGAVLALFDGLPPEGEQVPYGFTVHKEGDDSRPLMRFIGGTRLRYDHNFYTGFGYADFEARLRRDYFEDGIREVIALTRGGKPVIEPFHHGSIRLNWQTTDIAGWAYQPNENELAEEQRDYEAAMEAEERWAQMNPEEREKLLAEEAAEAEAAEAKRKAAEEEEERHMQELMDLADSVLRPPFDEKPQGTTPLPKELIEAELLRFDRNAASMLMAVLADNGLSFAEVDARLNAAPGHTEGMLLSMMRGEARFGEGVVEPLLAMGHRAELVLNDWVPSTRRAADAAPETARTSPDDVELIRQLSGVLREVFDRDACNTCLHEDTYRGGSNWEICNQCGAKWADDEGGKPEDAHKEPEAWERASKALRAAKERLGT